jgi:lysophospholipase L1-like esterase
MNWGSSKQDVWNNSSQGYYNTVALSGAISSEVNIGRFRTGGVYRVEPFKTGMVWYGSTLTDAEAQDVGIATYDLEVACGRTLFTGTPMYFIGDSNGAGQSAFLYAQAWASIVASNKSCRPVNLAVPGQMLTVDSSGRKSAYSQRARLLDYTPGTVVMNLGTNDAQYDGVLNGNPTTIADFKAKAIEMTELWQAHGHTVLLCSLIYSTNVNINATKRAAYALATSEAAADTGAGFCDLNALMTNSVSPLPGAMMQDATHLNPTGHAFVASAVTAAL